MACIRKRRGKYVVDYRDPAGIRRWSTFDKKREADAEYDRVRNKRRRKTPPRVDPAITVDRYADHWLTQLRSAVHAGTIKPRTSTHYEKILGTHVRPILGLVRICDLERADVKRGSCTSSGNWGTPRSRSPSTPMGNGSRWPIEEPSTPSTTPPRSEMVAKR